MSTLLADQEAPIISLSAKKHFEELPTTEAKLYAHYLSRAAHWGSRAVLRSVSPESEAIFDLILGVHKALGLPKSNEEYQSILKDVVSAEAVTQYLEYASQFLGNLGNYKSFGDSKFVPRVAQEDFAAIVKAANKPELAQLYDIVKEPLFATSPHCWAGQRRVSYRTTTLNVPL